MSAAASPREPPGTSIQLFAFGGGMTSWLVALVAGWVLNPVACGRDATWVLHLLAAASAALAASALAVSLRARGRIGDGTGAAGGRAAFMLRSGIWLNSLALLVIALMWLLIAFVEPCAGDQEFPLWVDP